MVGSTDPHTRGTPLGGVPREQKMLKGHLPRVIYHRVYSNIRRQVVFFFFFITLGLEVSDTKSLRALNTSPPGTASQYKWSTLSGGDVRWSGTYNSSTTQGPSWGYLKVNSSETLSIFGDKCPRNGSKNEQTAPRTSMGYPHIGPSVALNRIQTLAWHALRVARRAILVGLGHIKLRSYKMRTSFKP